MKNIDLIDILVTETGARFELDGNDLYLVEIVNKKTFFFFVAKIQDYFGFDINKAESIDEMCDMYNFLLSEDKRMSIKLYDPFLIVILRKYKLKNLMR